MNRGAGLPSGLANLGDTVQVVDRDGTDLGVMIVAAAQKLAADENAELFVIEPTASPPVVRVVQVRKLADLVEAELRRTLV
jgi:predicted phosphoribosyltransferase